MAKKKVAVKRKSKPKRYYTRTIDLLFLLVLLLIAIYFFYTAFNFGILPLKWVLITFLIVGFLYVFLFFLSLKKLPKPTIIIKRVFIVFLCLILGLSGYYLSKGKSTLKKMSNSSKGTISQMYIVVNKDSDFTSLEDLNGAVVGFQIGVDEDNAAYVKEQLANDRLDYIELESLDYTTLFNDLQYDYIQAMAISDTYYQMSANNIEGFEDSVRIIHTYERQNEPIASNIDVTKDTFTVYLSGIDSTGSPDQQTRTDTNLLLIVNPVAKHIDMVSLPRDGYMPNTALNYENDKLTHTGIYGIETSVETIAYFFQIPVDFYARVSFNSLIEIVDTIGGIDVDVELDFCEQDENRSFAQDDLICLEAGKQHLNGQQALAYARHRKTAGYDNAGRERAQQRIIKAIINKLISPSALGYVNDLMEIAPNYVITNMSYDLIAEFVSNELDSRKPWTISSLSSDNGTYADLYVASIPYEQGTSNVYLFSQEEVQQVIDAYDGASNQLQMQSFHFNFYDLYADTPSINTDWNICWDSLIY